MKIEKKVRSNKGFTLVELVVVIAVLAILAGVGTVAYRGYITKANEAADVTLLAAVKTAVDAAYAENTAAVEKIVVTNEDSTIGNVKYSITVKVTVKGSQEVDLSSAAKEGPAFATFFAGNGDAELKSTTYSAKGATWTPNKWEATP